MVADPNTAEAGTVICLLKVPLPEEATVQVWRVPTGL